MVVQVAKVEMGVREEPVERLVLHVQVKGGLRKLVAMAVTERAGAQVKQEPAVSLLK